MGLIKNIQLAGILLCGVFGPLVYGAVIAGADPYLMSYIIAVTTFVGMNLIMLAPILARAKGTAITPEAMDKLLVGWLWLTAITHVTWELGWCIAHPYLHDVGPDDTWAWFFWAYGIADTRYLFSDPFIVIMEWCTALIGGPMGFYVLWLTYKKRLKLAALWILLVSAMELYGTILYFGTEAVDGFRHVNTSHPIDLWFKFVGMNVIWIVYPIVSIVVALRYLSPPQSGHPAPHSTA